jgi:hypothetical protein
MLRAIASARKRPVPPGRRHDHHERGAEQQRGQHDADRAVQARRLELGNEPERHRLVRHHPDVVQEVPSVGVCEAAGGECRHQREPRPGRTTPPCPPAGERVEGEDDQAEGKQDVGVRPQDEHRHEEPDGRVATTAIADDDMTEERHAQEREEVRAHRAARRGGECRGRGREEGGEMARAGRTAGAQHHAEGCREEDAGQQDERPRPGEAIEGGEYDLGQPAVGDPRIPLCDVRVGVGPRDAEAVEHAAPRRQMPPQIRVVDRSERQVGEAAEQRAAQERFERADDERERHRGEDAGTLACDRGRPLEVGHAGLMRRNWCVPRTERNVGASV